MNRLRILGISGIMLAATLVSAQTGSVKENLTLQSKILNMVRKFAFVSQSFHQF